MASKSLPNVEVEQLEHGQIASLLELDPETLDPSLHYRWVNATPLKVGKAKVRGYRAILSDSGVRTLAGYLDDTSDGTMRIQDVILMACPVEKWRGRKRAALKQVRARLSAPKKQFKKNARAKRVRVITNEEDE